PEAQDSHEINRTNDHNKPSFVVSGCDRKITSGRSRPRLHAVRRIASKKGRQIVSNLTGRRLLETRPCWGYVRRADLADARRRSGAMPMTSTSIPKWQIVTGWVLSGILAFAFLPSAYFKIAQPANFIEEWTKSYPAGAALPLGIVELTMFVLYLVPKTRYL